MADVATLNSDIRSDTNSGKKSPETTTLPIPAPPQSHQESTASKPENIENNSSDVSESPHLRELYKSIRNINKKISNASKVDNVVAENPNLTLDELVATRKINADQKAQILKKPALQASLAQLEVQVSQFKKIEVEFRTRSENEKSDLERTLKEKANKELDEAVASVKAQERENAQKNLEQNLLLISQFLKLAAIRRAEEEIAELEESKALEGLLAQVYSGDSNAVAAMLNLINGSEATLMSVNGEPLGVTYAALKAASQIELSLIEAELGVEALEETVSEHPTQSNSNGSNLEINGTNTATPDMVVNGKSESFDPSDSPNPSNPAVSIVAGPSLDTKKETSPPLQEWDVAPKHNHTANGVKKKHISKGRNWADDHLENSVEGTSKSPVVSDGFKEINRNRGGRGNRGARGEGHRGRYRGEGYRGRGRGRGGGEGHRGGGEIHRGGRISNE